MDLSSRWNATRRLGVALIALSLIAPAHAAPRAELWPRWQAHDPAATVTVNHQAWDTQLARHVHADSTGANRFDYAAVTPKDHAALKTYLQGMAAVPVSRLRRAEQLAYWINLYNALTVNLVLDHYPVASIRDIDIGGLFDDGPWARDLVLVEGERIGLDDIEHRILRPIWADPRIHYALNCAAVGCPQLATRAYRAHTVDAMLDAGARAFINHPRGVSVNADGVTVSSLYVWYAEDFGGTEAAAIAHFRAYARPELAVRLAGARSFAGHRYDWRLNDVE